MIVFMVTYKIFKQLNLKKNKNRLYDILDVCGLPKIYEDNSVIFMVDCIYITSLLIKNNYSGKNRTWKIHLNLLI